MNCFFCKGDYDNELTSFTVDLGNCIIIVKDVPSRVCSQCGEVSYDDGVARRLEEIVDRVRDTVTEIAVVHYSPDVA
jgi:YgiT-type zinc finger domain-containing protein